MNDKHSGFLDWVIYQIYPRSFYDTNHDGIGDIPGVIAKLDYLQELGVNAIWMCPCYKSPNYDNGYDVADYRDIMDEFGTMDDMKRLIAEMDRRNMKLIMDLVPNHTSHLHRWFQESRKSKDNPYSDYYYWADRPLNDWTSCFCGSAWDYDEVRGQYYLHSYTIQQPDLNWNNPKVVKEIQDVIDFWVDMGVAGFRVDVIDQISKDFEGGVNAFGPRLHEFIHAMFGRDKVKHIFTVGECWTGNPAEIRRHIGEDRGELSTLFEFSHTNAGRADKWTPKEDSLKTVRDILVRRQEQMQKDDLLYSLFTDNHDQNMFNSRIGNDGELRYESATCIAAMFYLLRGVPFIYQGQEIGRAGSHYEAISDFRDVECLNQYREFIDNGMDAQTALEKINFGSRDNSRRPMAWDNSPYYGFSDTEPWMPVPSRGGEINLENDLQAEKSVFRFYQALLKLRKEHGAFRQGRFDVLSRPEDNFFVYERRLDEEKFTVVCNFDAPSEITCDGMDGAPVLSNCGMKAGERHFPPYGVAVYRN